MADAAEAVPSRLQRAVGRVEIGFGLRAGACRLLLHQEQGCAKARFPKLQAGAVPEAVLLNTAGGLTDGDRIEQAIDLGAGGSLCVTTQAAEKVYRARAAPAVVRTAITVGPGASLFWLPQETILFDAARLDRCLDVKLGSDSLLVAAECLILGRTAHGEEVRSGSLVDRRDIRIAGQLTFAERFRLDGNIEIRRRAPALLGGARAVATLLVLGPAAESLLEPLREVQIEAGVRVGSSWRAPVLVTRLLGDDAMALRSTLVRLIRAVADRLAPSLALPRVWLC